MLMSKSTFKTACAGILLSLATAPALADVLYSHTPIDQGDGLSSNVGAGAQNADDLSFAAAVRIESLHWWGSYDGADIDDFVVRLFADDAGAPAANAFAQYAGISVAASATALTDIVGATVYEYAFQLPVPLDLAAGIYYLSITNETTQAYWYWLYGAGGDAVRWDRQADIDPWGAHASSADFALRVEGVVAQRTPLPEPGELALMAAGLAAMGGGARQRRGNGR